MIRELLFEKPMGIYIAMLVIEAVIAALWLRRRARFWRQAMIVPVVLALAAGVTAKLVVTDREYIEAALRDMVSAAEKYDYAPAEWHMHPQCRMKFIGRVEMGPRVIVNVCRDQQKRLGVRSIDLKILSTEPVKGEYVTDCRTVIDTTAGGPMPIRWRLVWVRYEDRLQLAEIEMTEVAGVPSD